MNYSFFQYNFQNHFILVCMLLYLQEENSSPEVFISYQWGKQKEISVLYRRLTGLGFTCWMDIHQMGGGDSLYDKIDRGIRGCKVVLTSITQKYALSANCRREVSLADALKKPIIPLLMEKSDWPPSGPMSMVFTQLLFINFCKDETVQLRWDGPKFDELLQQMHMHVPAIESKKNESESVKAMTEKKPVAVKPAEVTNRANNGQNNNSERQKSAKSKPPAPMVTQTKKEQDEAKTQQSETKTQQSETKKEQPPTKKEQPAQDVKEEEPGAGVAFFVDFNTNENKKKKKVPERFRVAQESRSEVETKKPEPKRPNANQTAVQQNSDKDKTTDMQSKLVRQNNDKPSQSTVVENKDKTNQPAKGQNNGNVYQSSVEQTSNNANRTFVKRSEEFDQSSARHNSNKTNQPQSNDKAKPATGSSKPPSRATKAPPPVSGGDDSSNKSSACVLL